jgi:hypothetical protein
MCLSIAVRVLDSSITRCMVSSVEEPVDNSARFVDTVYFALHWLCTHAFYDCVGQEASPPPSLRSALCLELPGKGHPFLDRQYQSDLLGMEEIWVEPETQPPAR